MGKTVLITGGSRGIGAQTAITFAEKGYNIALNYVRNKDAALETANEIENAGGTVSLVQGDASDFDQSRNIVKKTIDIFGAIDVLINNAAIKRDGPINTMDESDYDKVMDINAKGSWQMIKHTVALNPKDYEMRIINISSGTGIVGKADQVNYVMSKFAINGLTIAMAKELGPHGITVNAVAPGLTETDMTSYVTEEGKQARLKDIPLGRIGTTQDIADACLFLASDQASFINGQILPVNGGVHTA